jgi:hypothetical protein
MEPLTLTHSTSSMIRKILGVLFFFNGLFRIIGSFDSLRLFDWIISVSIVLLGGLVFFYGFGYEKTVVQQEEVNLKIKWINKYKEIYIPYNEIENISMDQFKLIILLKSRKPVKLNLSIFDFKERRIIYEYFLSCSKMRGFSFQVKP